MKQKVRQVLLLETDKIDQNAFKQYVKEKRLPYDYKIAESIAEAKEMLNSQAFEIVISDYLFDDPNIFDIFNHAKNVPLIITTRSSDGETAVRAIKAGAYDYLIKDPDRNYLNILPGAIENVIEQKNAREQLRMLSNALSSTKDSVYITDMERNIIFVNNSFCRTYGYEKEDIVGKKSDILFCRKESINKIVDEGTELYHKRKDGSKFIVLLSQSIVKDDNGNDVALVGVARDITLLKKAEESLQASERSYRNLVDNALVGIYRTHLNGEILYVNKALVNIVGFDSAEELKTTNVISRYKHKQDREVLLETLKKTGKVDNFELEILTKKGDTKVILLSAVLEGDTLSGMIVDITERKETAKKLKHYAFHDMLTNLPNRSLFKDRLAQAIERLTRRKDYCFAVLFVDLDRFKIVNDSLGHLIGDQLLIRLAPRLLASIRSTDTISRFGGDEFAILVDDIRNVRDATIVAERVLKKLEEPFIINKNKISTTASIGIAISTTGYDNTEHILRDADTAMYRAKALGRARYALFDSEMHSYVVKLLQTETDLRRAIKRKEFRIHYQPIISLSTGKIVSVEALFRWQHPKRGLLPPSEFRELAEETRLISPINDWVLKTACVQNKVWIEAGYKKVRMSVNFSPYQFEDRKLVESIALLLKEQDIDPSWLEIEITEHVFMGNEKVTQKMLTELHTMGIKIAIDDFGTGYSSLGYLKRFPIDIIKIGQSFIKEIPENKDVITIAKAIITLAHGLGLKVIAEGVETEKQLAILQSHHCDMVQGFLFSQPLPAEQVTKLLRTDQQF